MPDEASAVPHAGASMPQHVCTRCGHLVYVPRDMLVPCAWCSGVLVQVVVAGVPVAKDKEYASYLE